MGLLFAYMGPVDKVPELPIYDCVDNPEDNQPVPFRMQVPCNWVQIVENGADPIHNAYLHAIVAGQQFSEAFRVLPQLDFPETPLGFLSMATRKVGDYIFIRASDIILPNFGQFPNGANRVEKQSVGLRPFLTRWSVPVDDQNSFYMGFAHLNSYNSSVRKMSKEDFGVDRIPFIGQTGDRPYFERQREPGDYDAVVTQGAIANRKSEHLGTTDRGVVLFRRMLAKAIRDTQEGIQPEKPMLYSNSKVKTYCHEIVVKAPAGVDFSDSQKLAEFGRSAALSFVEFDHLSPKEREESVTKRVQDMINAWPVGPK
jgi:phenylpropionate dioxygenase-like ring-hydroxylating dioxygenase large terminal subunit